MSGDNSTQAVEQAFTVFCVEKEERRFSWIGAMITTTVKEAARLGRAECAEAWGVEEEDVRVQGVAEGDVTILEWKDEGCVASDS